jgi:hypothetical protein
MDMVNDVYDVTYAHMSETDGSISVSGKNGPMTIDIVVNLNEEESNDA